ncbi:unnamed protein product [Musa acuminata var. zebrina]
MGREPRVDVRQETCLSYHQRQDQCRRRGRPHERHFHLLREDENPTLRWYFPRDCSRGGRGCGGNGGREVATYHGVVIVGKLVFIINKKAYGPLGNMGGTPFDLPITAGMISRFFGRGVAACFLTPLGVYLEP